MQPVDGTYKLIETSEVSGVAASKNLKLKMKKIMVGSEVEMPS